ncbi:hypothetical protein [Photorhabdus heterorhabditis]|uniref:hypothetical protein n=1 Tax=Photorhabdus heterorhabditis TaxID=880156 RepID=UPI001561D41F|nr:hypothetical protein [Photorhabdus heterorhabditis]NRN29147.1 hypothetical protein [Photorhabdus heterorhabditis subsp. aluminescens]
MTIISILMKIVMHITQGIIGAVCVFSIMGLVYFTLMSTLENRYQYAIVAGICLAFSVFLLYNRKNKRKMPIVSVSVNKDIYPIDFKLQGGGK